MKNTQSLKLNRDFRRAYKGDNFVGGYTAVSYTHLDVYKRQVLTAVSALTVIDAAFT